MDKVIKVSNCWECPYKGERCYCNINDEIDEYPFDLPKDTVHTLCPLKQGKVIVELENKGDETK